MKNIDKNNEDGKKQFSSKLLTPAEIDSANLRRIAEIEKEFKDGFEFIKKYQKSISFFGSARFKEDNIHYAQARRLAYRISKELGYAIITGGGPGIMEAANRGAFEAGGGSFGMTIKLPREQVTNPYVKNSIDFYFFFVRKVMLTFSAEVYIFFPGGFGTFDEFFDILTLVQTHKIPRVPIILMGKDFWLPLQSFIEKHLLEVHETVDKSDLNLYHITDNEEEILEIIKNAPLRRE